VAINLNKDKGKKVRPLLGPYFAAAVKWEESSHNKFNLNTKQSTTTQKNIGFIIYTSSRYCFGN
jgi:hypothetical protein